MTRDQWVTYDPTGTTREATFQDWNDLGEWQDQLQSKKSRIVYVSPDAQRIYDLAGAMKGNRGIVLDEGLKGTSGSPFEQRYTGGPFMLGETPERTDWGKRVIQAGFHMGPALNAFSRLRYRDTPFALRAIQEQWWDDWPEDVEQPMGFWGEFTRYSGWRWTRVRHGEANDMIVERDPQYAGNNYSTAPMTIHAPFPFFAKRMLTREWAATDALTKIGGVYHGVLRLPNRGDYPQWPKFIVEGTGDVTIQDGMTDRMVPLPKVRAQDGMILVDTDPSKRTLTAEHDPIDTPLWKLIRSSMVLDFLIGDITQADAGVPIGRRIPGGVGFMSEVPAMNMAVIKVTHSNPRGKITMLMPQWYRRGVVAG